MVTGFRERLRAGERLLGTILSLDAPEAAEILASLGFDWLFIDAEHAPLDAARIRAILQAVGPQLPCLVRLLSADEAHVKQALDVGASGVIAPMISSPEQAENLVRFAKYPPRGQRGVGLARAQGYGKSFADYVRRANDELVVVVQIEQQSAVEQIEAIAAVPGIDACFVGPYDLSSSLGKPGAVNDPQVMAAIARVTAACQAAGVALGIFGINADALRPFLRQGYSLIAAGVDTGFLAAGAAALLAELKA